MRQKASLDHDSCAVRDEAPQKRATLGRFGAEIRDDGSFRIREQGLQKGVHHE